jgi:hypothetical protein
MGAASAEISSKRLTDFGSGRMWVPVEERLCGHDHSVDTVTALRCLLGNESLLKWMGLVDSTKPFQRNHRCGADGRQREHTGADSLGADYGGARTALRKAASKFRSIKAEIIAQNVEQRRVAIGRDDALGRVYMDAERFRHRILPPRSSYAACARRARRVASALSVGFLPELTHRQSEVAFGEEGAVKLTNLIEPYCTMFVTLNAFDGIVTATATRLKPADGMARLWTCRHDDRPPSGVAAATFKQDLFITAPQAVRASPSRRSFRQAALSKAACPRSETAPGRSSPGVAVADIWDGKKASVAGANTNKGKGF